MHTGRRRPLRRIRPKSRDRPPWTHRAILSRTRRQTHRRRLRAWRSYSLPLHSAPSHVPFTSSWDGDPQPIYKSRKEQWFRNINLEKVFINYGIHNEAHKSLISYISHSFRGHSKLYLLYPSFFRNPLLLQNGIFKHVSSRYPSTKNKRNNERHNSPISLKISLVSAVFHKSIREMPFLFNGLGMSHFLNNSLTHETW
jgi:hypothetical protein